jgi:cardiolipin synthase A/B
VSLLRDGAQAFPSMLEAIAEAKHFISLETYIIQPDSIGTRFRDALTEAAARGVEVRVIFDSIGSFETGAFFWRPLHAAGGQTVTFHDVASWKHWWAGRLNKRDHRKVLVVDGEVGFCGGINIHDQELPTEQGGANWRDVHVRIEGPVVAEIQSIFLQTWSYGGGPPARGRPLRHVAGPRGDEAVRVVATDALLNRFNIHRAYLRAISSARRSISLWNPYFIPDGRVRRALKRARARGVEVRVIVPARGDIAAVQFASRKLYARLLRAGVRIFEWREHVMHAKCGVIDGEWSTVGSFNLDHRSLVHNLELNAMVYGESFGRQMEAMFEEDLESCAEVDPRSWRYRSFLDRLLETFFYFFRYWF